jgi:hypothetical protein
LIIKNSKLSEVISVLVREDVVAVNLSMTLPIDKNVEAVAFFA